MGKVDWENNFEWSRIKKGKKLDENFASREETPFPVLLTCRTSSGLGLRVAVRQESRGFATAGKLRGFKLGFPNAAQKRPTKSQVSCWDERERRDTRRWQNFAP